MTGSELPDLVGLRMLVALSESGSITAAGARVGVTQQAVSQRLRLLERRLGVALVQRSARGSALTDAGRLVAGWAGGLLDEVGRFDEATATLRSESDEQVRVAASLTIAEHLVPQWLAALRGSAGRSRGPVVRVDLTAVNSVGVVELVRSGAVQLGLVETPDVPRDLRSRHLGDDVLVVVVAPTHPWARRRKGISARELAATPLVSRESGSGTRRSLEAVLDAHEPPLALVAPAAELPTTAAVRTAVSSGLAPAALSRLAVRDELAVGRLVAVDVVDLDLTRPLTAVWLARRGALPRAALALLRTARATTSPRDTTAT